MYVDMAAACSCSDDTGQQQGCHRPVVVMWLDWSPCHDQPVLVLVSVREFLAGELDKLQSDESCLSANQKEENQVSATWS